jgi:MSHA biogenesis protein MshL
VYKYGTILKLILLGCVFLFSSCAVNPPQSSNVENQIEKALRSDAKSNKILDRKQLQHYELPSFINHELAPEFSINIPAEKISQQHFDVAVKDVPAKDFFIGLMKDTKESIMVSPQVTGTISLHLKNVTVPEVLEAIRDAYGYEYRRTSYGYGVFPRQMQTRIFTVNYLDINRQGKSYTTVSSGEISRKITHSGQNGSVTASTRPSSSIDTDSDTDFWKTLKDTLDVLVNKKAGESAVINSQSGLIFVHAYPETQRDVAQYLDNIQNIVQRQVIIEAKIIEVELNAQYQSGVQWNVFGLRQLGFQDFDNINSGGIVPFTNIFTLNISSGDAFNTVINLLNTQGKVNVLSSPRVAAINNQKAVIKVGEDRFFVTNVKSDIVASAISTNGIVSQDIDFTPFFSGIALDVIPQIDKNDNVILHIHPLVSKVTEDQKEFEVNGRKQEYPMAHSDVRESDTVVRAKSGQVIVIGGLMETISENYQAGTPGAEDLPKIGGLFKDLKRQSHKAELIILLRPTVISDGTWTRQLQQAVNENEGLQGDFAYSAKLDLRDKLK